MHHCNRCGVNAFGVRVFHCSNITSQIVKKYFNWRIIMVQNILYQKRKLFIKGILIMIVMHLNQILLLN